MCKTDYHSTISTAIVLWGLKWGPTEKTGCLLLGHDMCRHGSFHYQSKDEAETKKRGSTKDAAVRVLI